ncbi:hypothetical protein KM043_010529 [Ampulex compressa]|nr:hypothetical protein KM043_010529 [Ampulex compressa]
MTAALVMENINWDPALSKLLNSLQENKSEIPSCTDEEFGFLSDLLQSKELNALVNVHNKILSNVKDDKFFPVLSNSMDIDIDVLDLLSTKTHHSADCKELFHLLQRPHIQGLLCAHDAIAQKDYYPRLPEIPLEVDEDEETVKIVQLVKSNEPLGATIKTCDVTGKIVIARIMHGGAADRSGLIHVGDEVCEVNGISVEGKTPNCVLNILQNSEGTITFKIVPADSKGGIRESKVRVRAHFSYKAADDPYIPCKEAGLDFVKGDVLHIVSQDDAYWWQARREGDRNMRAGLIPSRALQERRIILERQQREKTDDDGISLCSVPVPLPALCPRPSTSLHASPTKCNLQGIKTKKIMYDAAENDDFDREEIPTYEEVAKLYPRPGLYRPVVLIGPPGVGRNELKRRLMATDPDKYKTPVPYTSRPPRPGEINGKEYHFVGREKMEEEIEGGKFIEYGEYKGNLYGTSAESVTSLINAGYVCLLNPHYQALKMLRTAQSKPYVIYVKPPRFEILKETRSEARARSTFDESNSRGFTDEEFEEILHSAARIEFLYSHLFDEVIVNADLSMAFEQLERRGEERRGGRSAAEEEIGSIYVADLCARKRYPVGSDSRPMLREILKVYLGVPMSRLPSILNFYHKLPTHVLCNSNREEGPRFEAPMDRPAAAAVASRIGRASLVLRTAEITIGEDAPRRTAANSLAIHESLFLSPLRPDNVQKVVRRALIIGHDDWQERQPPARSAIFAPRNRDLGSSTGELARNNCVARKTSVASILTKKRASAVEEKARVQESNARNVPPLEERSKRRPIKGYAEEGRSRSASILGDSREARRANLGEGSPARGRRTRAEREEGLLKRSSAFLTNLAHSASRSVRKKRLEPPSPGIPASFAYSDASHRLLEVSSPTGYPGPLDAIRNLDFLEAGSVRSLPTGWKKRRDVSIKKSVSFSSDTSFEAKRASYPKSAVHEVKVYRKGVLQERSACGERKGAKVPPSWETASAGPLALLRAARQADDTLLTEIVARTGKLGFAGMNVNVTDASGRTAISYMAGNGASAMLELALSFEGVDPNLPDNEGNTPLHFAAQAGQTECLNVLLQRCSDIEVDARNTLGFTPLMKAALQGRTKCAKILLFAGANPTLRDHGRGLRAEQWARFCGRYVCAEVIERFARHRLLERSTSCRWGSEPELAAKVLQGKVTPIPAGPLPPPSSGLKSKIRKVFRTTSGPDRNFSLVSQLTSAALCASSPALPKSSEVPSVVKSLLRPLSVPQLRVTLVSPQDFLEKTSEKYGSNFAEKIENTIVKPPRSKKKNK